jgi:hypothetical protein
VALRTIPQHNAHVDAAVKMARLSEFNTLSHDAMYYAWSSRGVPRVGQFKKIENNFANKSREEFRKPNSGSSRNGKMKLLIESR